MHTQLLHTFDVAACHHPLIAAARGVITTRAVYLLDDFSTLLSIVGLCILPCRSIVETRWITGQAAPRRPRTPLHGASIARI
jgi:hypothetical protein